MDQTRTKSTRRVEIVPVEMTAHSNAVSLSVIPVYGYSYVGRTADWLGVKRAAYIPPDSVVDTDRPEFAFLKEKPVLDADGKLVGHTTDETIKTFRVKAKKLRGVISFGLLIPVPDETPLGDDWGERLGVSHYEPETSDEREAKQKLCLGGDNESAPACNAGGYYDIEAARRYAKDVFVPGEPVFVHEKLDGSNMRVVFWDGRLWVKSRNNWKRRQANYDHLTVEGLIEKGVPEDKAREIIERKKTEPARVNGFWQVVENTPGLARLCECSPGTVVFGEIFGNVNCIKYGFAEGNRFAAFDVFRGDRFLDPLEAMHLAAEYGVPWAPLLNRGPLPFDFDKLCELAEGPTLCERAKTKVIREGIVVRPVRDRFERRLGRVVLKFVSGAYLEKYR